MSDHTERRGTRTRRAPSDPTELNRSAITLSSREVPIVALGQNYGEEWQGQIRIQAMTPQGSARKQHFQSDAGRYVHALGQALCQYGGFTHERVSRNRGGPQGAGSVQAAFYHPRLSCWLSVYLQADPKKTELPRADGVVIIVCRRPGRQTRESERWYHLNPAMNSLQLAMVLLILVGLKQPEDFACEDAPPPGDDPSHPSLFVQGGRGEDAASPDAPRVRVNILGAYRQCRLILPGRTSVEVVCVDSHPTVALGYWGKRSTHPISSVHPDDRAICTLAAAETGRPLDCGP